MDKVPIDLDHLTKLENHMPFSSLTTLDEMVSREYNFVFVAVPEFFHCKHYPASYLNQLL